jgi:hypothetical protein
VIERGFVVPAAKAWRVVRQASTKSCKSLAELALEGLPRTDCLMGVDVRNECRELVLVCKLTFKAEVLVGSAE